MEANPLTMYAPASDDADIRRVDFANGGSSSTTAGGSAATNGGTPSGVVSARRDSMRHRVNLPLDEAPTSLAGGLSGGTRRFWMRLRVAQWEGINGEPAIQNVAISQAALLFDVAYAAALAHHAHILLLVGSTRQAGDSLAIVLVYLSTATAAVMNWWQISLFLCKFDPGDLLNEYLLVVCMVFVVGQSITVQGCSSCLVSDNLENLCVFDPREGREFEYNRQGCTVWGRQGEHAEWPMMPFQCYLYSLCSLLPRVLHLINLGRAAHDVQPRGRSDALLHMAEHACVLPLWLFSFLYRGDAHIAVTLFALSTICEFAVVMCEPARLLAHWLHLRGSTGFFSTPVESIPIDAAYTERRWHRLLMIALAMLPSFSSSSDEFTSAFASPHFVDVRLMYMCVSCTLAYLIKLYYFDVSDDRDLSNWLNKGGLTRVQHALHQVTSTGGLNWRGSFWIATHVLLIVAVCAEGVAVNRLLLPWDGWPEDGMYAALRARYLIVIPMSVILWVLALQQSMHKGAGHGHRRIGRKKRLLFRTTTGFALLLLPLLLYGEPDVPIDTPGCLVSPPPPSLPPSPASPAPDPHHQGPPPTPTFRRLEAFSPPPPAPNGFPNWALTTKVSSRFTFISLLFSVLLLNLMLELYGRRVYMEDGGGMAMRELRVGGNELGELGPTADTMPLAFSSLRDGSSTSTEPHASRNVNVRRAHTGPQAAASCDADGATTSYGSSL